MALSGLALFLFVVGHLVGNLQVFLGPEALNRYGHFLQSNLELLWPVRMVLLLLLALHLWAATSLTLENRAARPQDYALRQLIGSTYASRTMFLGGTIIFTFLVYHLLHYTFEVKSLNLTDQDFATFVDEQQRHDVFRMVVVGFSKPWVSAFYILGIGLLCFHLSHGVSSLFQSLGWKNEAYRPLLDNLARVLAVLIFVGYVSIPVAVLLGLVKLPH